MLGFSGKLYMPKSMCVCFFYGFICDFLEFPSLKSSNIFTAHLTQPDTNFKREKRRVYKDSFFDFFKFMSFTAAQKTGLIDFPGKQAPTKVKYLLTVFPILCNFAEGNPRKLTVSLAFCVHVDQS